MAGDVLYDSADSPPIPSYEEATSSTRETQSLLSGAGAVSGGRRRDGYQPPTVRSPRGSEDSTKPYNHDDSDDDSIAGLDRQFEEMEVLDEDMLGDGGESRFRRGWKGRLVGLRRSMDRWKKMWAWRRPSWLEGIGPVRLPWAGMSAGMSEGITERMARFGPSLPIIARLFGLFIIIMAGYALFVWEIMPTAGGTGMGQMFDPEGVRVYAQAAVSGERLREYLRHFTQYSHMAGTEGSEVLAEDMSNYMRQANMDDVKIDIYKIYMNWATKEGRRVAIISPPDLAWEARLDEDSPYSDPSTSKANSLPFHTYAKAGNVTGHLVYANYGSHADFQKLYDVGIDLKGAIALVRYGQPNADVGSKVKAAEEWGVTGVLTYSDPQDGGSARGESWPAGKYRSDNSIERGSVSLSSYVIGDPLTPGWASSDDASRISKDDAHSLVKIPSLPISAQDAQRLLEVLKGHGQRIEPSQQSGWMGRAPDVEWWTGDKTSPIIHLQNEQREGEKERIFNVMATMRGEIESSKQIVVGAHRDAYCFGATDSASGTAILLEVMEIFGELRKQGWRPLRSIIFASWDARHYNMAGSTEWVEDHLDELRKDGVAYLNIDVGISGPDLRARGSPMLQQAFLRAVNRASDPLRNVTMRSWWDEHGTVQGLGADGDYVAFQNMAGMPSFDIGFEGDGYPAHSCFDTFEWMAEFGDRDLNYHKILAQIWVLMILELAQEPILPLKIDDYASRLVTWLSDLGNYAKDKGDRGFRATPIWQALTLLKDRVEGFHAWEDWWYGQVYARGGFETTSLEIMRVTHNNRILDFESSLLDLGQAAKKGVTQPGLPNRTQFKHVIYGPQLQASNEPGYFPGIRDAIDSGDQASIQHEVDKVAHILKKAAERLVP